MPSYSIPEELSRAVFRFNEAGFPVLKDDIRECMCKFISDKNPDTSLECKNTGFMHTVVYQQAPNIPTYTLTHRGYDSDAVMNLALQVRDGNEDAKKAAKQIFFKNMVVLISNKTEQTKKITEEIVQGLNECAKDILKSNKEKQELKTGVWGIDYIKGKLSKDEHTPLITNDAAAVMKKFFTKGGRKTRKRKQIRKRNMKQTKRRKY